MDADREMPETEFARAEATLDALGDRSRRAIIGLLAASPCSISDLADALGVSKTAIGQHITILEACALVSSEKKGRVRMCRIDPTGLDTLQRWVDRHRGHWQAGFGRLGDMLGDG